MTSELRQYFDLLKSAWRDVGRLYLLLVAQKLLAFLKPLFMLVFIDEVVVKSNLSLLVILVTAMIAWIAITAYLFGLNRYYRMRLGQRLLAELRARIFRHVVHQAPAFLDRNPPGRLVALSTNEIDAMDALHDFLLWGTSEALAVLLIGVICFSMDPALALFVLIPIPLTVVLGFLNRRMRSHNVDSLKRQARLFSFLKHRLPNIETIQAFGQEHRDVAKLEEMASDLADARSRTEMYVQIINNMLEFIRNSTLALILLVGGTRVIRGGGMTLGSLLAFYAYAELLFRIFGDSFNLSIRARLSLDSLRRVFGLLDDSESQIDATAGIQLRATGAIEFSNVWFRYSADQPYVLQDVSFSVRPGQFVAIVGLSGSGKSTLSRLLLRFLRPSQGVVRVDGHDIRTLSLRSLREQIGLATQDSVLFDDSVVNNIRYGRGDATTEEVCKAARVAVASEFIEALPSGFETLVGEGAADLSVGQRHRLAIARIVLKDSPIVLLDEATAALDARTEADLVHAMRAFTRGRTTIAIAHRLATVVDADLILVMNKGRIVQSGTHADLYERGGLYRELVDRQLTLSTTPSVPRKLRKENGNGNGVLHSE